MSIDIIKFIEEKKKGEYGERFDALGDLVEALRKEAEQGYLGELYRTTYEVQGKGEFPHDMLRYTCSWPAGENDSYRIEASHDTSGSQVTTVHLTKYHRDPQPTLSEDRWLSKFRWKVTNVIETVLL